jgi:hypothetical protein
VSVRKLAVIMDPIESIKPHKDSTLAMLLEAQSRGWAIHYARLDDIWLRDGEAFGRLTALRVAADPAHWFDLGDVAVTPPWWTVRHGNGLCRVLRRRYTGRVRGDGHRGRILAALFGNRDLHPQPFIASRSLSPDRRSS